MLIAAVKILIESGLNPNVEIFVSGTDIDKSVLLMAYLQLSLLGVPGEFKVGNSLTAETREVWKTPMIVWDSNPPT